MRPRRFGDGLQATGLSLATVLTSLLATLGPAHRAARIRPALATRATAWGLSATLAMVGSGPRSV